MESWLETERERIGLWVPVALGLGVAAWFALPGPRSWALWTGGCACLALAALALPEGGRVQRAALVLGLLAALGCLLVWGKALLVGERPIARPAYVEVQGRVVAVQPLVARGMSRLVIAPDAARTDLPKKIRVNVQDDDMVAGLGRGSIVQFRTRLMPPAPPSVPGAYDFARKAYFDGIGATGRALPPIRVITPTAEPLGSLRQRLSAHVRAQIGGGEGAIATALATGDTGAISESDAEAMRRSGLAHLLSISGLHVSALIAAVIWGIARVMALSRRVALHVPVLAVAAGGGALAGIGYTLLTGAEVPTVRSCIAALLVLGGLALGREAMSLRLIAAGAVVVLLLWPEALVGPSFQMSFTAVIVIVALAEAGWFRRLTHARDEEMTRKFTRALLALFITGLAIEAALMPIALYHFHQTGMLGALANLVAIPLTTFVVMPFEALALFLDMAGLGAPAWWIVGRALSLMLWVAHIVAAQKSGILATPAFAPWVLAALMLGMLWLMLWRTPARFAGLVPIAAGVCVIALAPVPDVLVTGDGRHLAVRQENGEMALLRARAGDYVRDTFSNVAGEGSKHEGELVALADVAGARCSADLCALDVVRGERRWRLLATRTRERVPWARFVRDCAEADIVVSDRRLPRGCVPRWLKLDRAALAQSGGVAVYLSAGQVVHVHKPGDRHPWIVPAPAYIPRARKAPTYSQL